MEFLPALSFWALWLNFSFQAVYVKVHSRYYDGWILVCFSMLLCSISHVCKNKHCNLCPHIQILRTEDLTTAQNKFNIRSISSPAIIHLAYVTIITMETFCYALDYLWKIISHGVIGQVDGSYVTYCRSYNNFLVKMIVVQIKIIYTHV